MPATPATINLLGQTDTEHSPEGRIVSWALTYGRYIMIGTEIVVLLAFISRFSLDRKRTDLKEEIAQKQAILEANLSYELQIRKTQDELSKIKLLLSTQSKPVDILKMVKNLLPPDVSFQELDVTADKLTAKAVAGTTEGFSQFLANLQGTKQILRVEVGDVTKSALSGIEFKFTAFLTAPKTTKQ